MCWMLTGGGGIELQTLFGVKTHRWRDLLKSDGFPLWWIGASCICRWALFLWSFHHRRARSVRPPLQGNTNDAKRTLKGCCPLSCDADPRTSPQNSEEAVKPDEPLHQCIVIMKPLDMECPLLVWCCLLSSPNEIFYNCSQTRY